MRTSWVWTLCLFGACTELPEEPPPEPDPEPSFRRGGEEGMNCMGAGHVTVVAGPDGDPMLLTTREAVARFGDEIQLTGWHTDSGGVVFVGYARSFDAIIHGTWFEKLYQVALPDEDWCGGVGPTGDLVGGHYDKAGLAGSCPADGAPVMLDAARSLIKAYLYALVQDSACPLPPGSDDAEGHFAAVEVIMLSPGVTYELQTLIDQDIVRPVPAGADPEYLCLIWDGSRRPPPLPTPTPELTPTVTIADADGVTTTFAVARAAERRCLYELGILEAVVEVDGGGLPISYAGPDELGAIGAVRDFLRSPEESQGTVTAIDAFLGCNWVGIICIPTVTLQGFDIDIAIGSAELEPITHHVWDPTRSIAVVLPINAEVTCSGECPPVMSSLAAAECDESPPEVPPGGEGGELDPGGLSP